MKKLSRINEGLWDGIVDRGTTGKKRKEDEINIDALDKIEFAEYLNNTYKFVDENHLVMEQTSNGLAFPLFRYNTSWFRLYISMMRDGVTRLAINRYRLDDMDFFDAVSSKFELKKDDFSGIIVTKDGKVSNSICIELINTVLLNTEDPIYDIKDLKKGEE